MNLTLKDIPKPKMAKEDIKKINTNLLLLFQLSNLQMNIAKDIERIYKKNGVYKMEIKHNHNKIMNFIREHANGRYWEAFTQEQIDALCEDADHLEELIMAWATNTMEEYFEKKMICSEQK